MAHSETKVNPLWGCGFDEDDEMSLSEAVEILEGDTPGAVFRSCSGVDDRLGVVEVDLDVWATLMNRPIGDALASFVDMSEYGLIHILAVCDFYEMKPGVNPTIIITATEILTDAEALADVRDRIFAAEEGSA